MKKFSISPEPISFEQLEQIIRSESALELSQSASDRITKCYQYLHQKIKNSNQPIYGINTGFGSLCDTKIDNQDLAKLQENLVKSHACGTGEQVPEAVVKLMLLLKIHALSLGHSGVAITTVQRLIDFYNLEIFPVVYQQGSLGASGDLAPLAHLSLPLLGLGEVNFKGKKQNTLTVLNELNLKPLELQAKEGLALLNGTQFMNAYACYCFLQIKRISCWSDLIAAMSLDAANARYEPFSPLIQNIRLQKGQIKTAENIREILSGSAFEKTNKKQVQDPYSFRCIPQVHGASKDVFAYAANIFENEMNAVTDNPTLFPDEDLIISGGNFHGQVLAITLDLLSIATAEIGSISERRLYKLIGKYNDLPSFLVSNPGINSGFMIPQYTAASIVSQNKQLASPASVDSIDSSQGQEDHVSMGANAATKLFRIVENVETLLAIELLTSAQALEFRRPLKSSKLVEELHQTVRKTIPFVKEDQLLHDLIKKSKSILSSYEIPKNIKAY